MAKNPNKKKVDPWKVINAILAALGSLFGSLKRSHDNAKAELEKPESTATSDFDE